VHAAERAKSNTCAPSKKKKKKRQDLKAYGKIGLGVSEHGEGRTYTEKNEGRLTVDDRLRSGGRTG